MRLFRNNPKNLDAEQAAYLDELKRANLLTRTKYRQLSNILFYFRMERRDARKLSTDAKEEIRRQAIKLHESGLSNVSIAEALEVHRSTVSGWVNRYKRSGFSELKAKRMGRTPGSGMQLSVSEQTKIKNKIEERNPEQLKMPFALWTREAVYELIQ